MSGSYGVAVASDARWTQIQQQPAESVGSAQWFAVQTRYRFEKKVVEQLNRKNCDVYLPLRTESRMWSDRRKAVTIPLFPGYAFVRIDQSCVARQAVLQTAGLIGFVSFGGVVTAVPAKQIDDLQLLLREKIPFLLDPSVHVGRRVRVRNGSLQGVEGILLQQKKETLVISIESIQRSLAIEIQGYELDLV